MVEYHFNKTMEQSDLDLILAHHLLKYVVLGDLFICYVI